MEKEFKITGQVTNPVSKPIPNAPVVISSQKPAFIASTNADANGIYEFKNLPKIDSGSFFLQASRKEGKKLTFGKVTVDKFKALPIPAMVRDAILPWYVNTDSTQLNYVRRVIEKQDEKT
ncbi:carboxypeptidase regulatory-like domain-containing protein [Mucilaginibacter sp. S1162]|uniref:Carboxypeptidase regulatory-like domain-containing protein n=1 Tax=Mucilaginibacter humi TaxID=2732510 RepID=A0ABX1W1J4_9SPHI|nr:carboxypeptidase-like regulatory domain-containing protein [Mucilaginibacter humi]NNU33818.1 carboxypeptidase regulatory-like domain-containing protein [Mucilaginibacter humi]